MLLVAPLGWGGADALTAQAEYIHGPMIATEVSAGPIRDWIIRLAHFDFSPDQEMREVSESTRRKAREERRHWRDVMGAGKKKRRKQRAVVEAAATQADGGVMTPGGAAVGAAASDAAASTGVDNRDDAGSAPTTAAPEATDTLGRM